MACTIEGCSFTCYNYNTLENASCIQRGNPIGYPCPFAKEMKEIIQKDLSEHYKLLGLYSLNSKYIIYNKQGTLRFIRRVLCVWL